jgi:hypothetical protein
MTRRGCTTAIVQQASSILCSIIHLPHERHAARASWQVWEEGWQIQAAHLVMIADMQARLLQF